MRSVFRGAVAIAIALAARTAAAHELLCTQTLNGKAALVIDNYPARVTALVTVANVHPSADSTAKSVEAPFLASVGEGFDMGAPFTLAVGAAKTAEVDFEIASAEECLRLARPDGILLSLVRVGWDLGEAQCNAELICKPQRCEAPAPAGK